MKNFKYPNPLSIRLPEDVIQALKVEAERDSRTVSQVILLAIRAYLSAKEGK